MSNSALEELCQVAAGLYARGYAHGSTGNVSVRTGERVWITPTGRSLERLTPESLACLSLDGAAQNEARPSKEFPFHLAAYGQREEARAIIHLHSTYAVALSCLAALDEAAVPPPLTPYYFMRVAPLAVLPYFRPGSPDLAAAVADAAGAHHCMLLRNHGHDCHGATLDEARDRAEELEQTARLYFILRHEEVRRLTPAEIDELRPPVSA